MSCKFCNGYYGKGYGQPVCQTCHSFVYDFTNEENGANLSTYEKDASGDSGNEEPEKASDFYVSKLKIPSLNIRCSDDDNSKKTPKNLAISRQPLSTHLLNMPRGVFNYIEHLPPEIILNVFYYLDDISLWSLRYVSNRFRSLIDSEIADSKWEEFVMFRWPLFSANYKISSWLGVYSNLINSSTCRYCLERMYLPVLFQAEAQAHTWRHKRISVEISNIWKDPPYGIRAMPLDLETYSHCQAAISGPPGSPYEGGLFYVFVVIPYSYPMRPPMIRFITRIFHPNVSLHGDVGLDCIRHNWSLALTVGKVLISVQSLLTDAYTPVCMEPAIALLFNENRPEFDRVARLWTWKYAMHDFLPHEYVNELPSINYPLS